MWILSIFRKKRWKRDIYFFLHSGTNHAVAGDTVLSCTVMHVAGLLTLRPLQALGDAVRLFHHTGVDWILEHALHAAVLHTTTAVGWAFTKDTGPVDVRVGLTGVRGHRHRGVHRVHVFIQAQELVMAQVLDTNRWVLFCWLNIPTVTISKIKMEMKTNSFLLTLHLPSTQTSVRPT